MPPWAAWVLGTLYVLLLIGLVEFGPPLRWWMRRRRR